MLSSAGGEHGVGEARLNRSCRRFCDLLKTMRPMHTPIEVGHDTVGGYSVTCLSEVERTTGFEPATLTLAKETHLLRQDRCTPLSSLSPVSSSAQSAESARLHGFTFNALNLYQLQGGRRSPVIASLLWPGERSNSNPKSPIGSTRSPTRSSVKPNATSTCSPIKAYF